MYGVFHHALGQAAHPIVDRQRLVGLGLVVLALLSVGGISSLTTSYRTGYITEAERRSLTEAGAVGDVLYNFISEDGKPVQREVNDRVISADLSLIRRCPERVLISGGKDKRIAMKAAMKNVTPTTLITDEQTAIYLLQ